MNKYGQYCPMARAAEILGDRWTLLIVRELLYGVEHFNDLERGLPGISKALLAERLRRLQRVGVLERQVDHDSRRTSYRLTPAGESLQPIMDSFIEWGARWCFGEPRPEELDPILLLWWIREGGIYTDRLPEQRVVVEFSFRGAPESSYWMVLEKDDISVCLKDPGFERDILVTADLSAFYEVWLGRITFAEAARREHIALDGPTALIRAFPKWLAFSPMAGAVRAAARHQHSG
jgi:DNA-binding HxlR family transcriptional regulator